MRKLSKTEVKTLTLRQYRIYRLRFLDDLFHTAEDSEKPDDMFLIRILEESRKFSNSVDDSIVSGNIETLKIEANRFFLSKEVDKKAVAVESLQNNRRNLRESLTQSKSDQLTPSNLAANIIEHSCNQLKNAKKC